MLVCWRYRRTPLLPSWLSPHRDATGDRIMHFSWGGECKCARCSSSVWAMFCSVNTYSFLWFDCLFLERQTSLVNNHVSSWDFFFNQMSSYNCYLGSFFLFILLCSYLRFILYSYTYCIITGFPCIFYFTVFFFVSAGLKMASVLNLLCEWFKFKIFYLSCAQRLQRSSHWQRNS